MAEAPSDNVVNCETHGRSSPAFVCTHLLEAYRARDVMSLGFHEGEPDPAEEGPYEPCAWCDACERVRLAAGGWNEESEGLIKIRLLCLECFDTVRILAARPAQ
jgi:hypothetical protein